MIPSDIILAVGIASVLASFIFEAARGLVAGRFELREFLRSLLLLAFLISLVSLSNYLISHNFSSTFLGVIVKRIEDRITIYECVANVFYSVGVLFMLFGVGLSTVAWLARILEKLKLFATTATIGEAMLSFGRTMLWFFVFLLIESASMYIATLFGFLVILKLLLDPTFWFSIALLFLALTPFRPLRGLGASLFSTFIVAGLMFPFMGWLAEVTLDIIAQHGIENIVADTYNNFLIQYANKVLGVAISGVEQCPTTTNILAGATVATEAITKLLTQPGFYYIDLVKFTLLTFMIPSVIYGLYISLCGTVALTIARYIAGNEAVVEGISHLLMGVIR